MANITKQQQIEALQEQLNHERNKNRKLLNQKEEERSYRKYYKKEAERLNGKIEDEIEKNWKLDRRLVEECADKHKFFQIADKLSLTIKDLVHNSGLFDLKNFKDNRIEDEEVLESIKTAILFKIREIDDERKETFKEKENCKAELNTFKHIIGRIYWKKYF